MIGLRDRARIALLGYTFARVGSAITMKVEDYCIPKKFLDEWLQASGLAAKPNAPLFSRASIRPSIRP
jgi:hypothetical protein